MKKIVLIILATLMAIGLFYLTYLIATFKSAPCESFGNYGVVQSVYYSPDSFGGYEHWTGQVFNKQTNNVENYEIYDPTSVGSTLFKRIGCGSFEKWRPYVY